MKVKAIKTIKNQGKYFYPGEVAEIEKAEAERLIEIGVVKPEKGSKEESPEKEEDDTTGKKGKGKK